MMYRSLFVVVFYQLVAGSPSPNICTTPACLNFANSLKNIMNTTINPCEDFYEFTCDQWSENNPIPSDRMVWNWIEKMRNDVVEKIIDMLNDDKTPTAEAYQKAQKMYRNCMDLEAIEKNGVEAILAQLRSTGGWPVMMPLNDWTSNAISLSQLLSYYIREFRLGPLYTIVVRPSLGNPSARIWVNVTYVTPFDNILRDHPPISSKVMQYADKIIEIVNILANATGNIVNAADVLKDVTDMIDFEWALVKLISTTEYVPNRKFTIKELRKSYNDLNISSLTPLESDDPRKFVFANIVSSILQNMDMNVTDDIAVMYWNVQRLDRLIEILEKASKRTIVNYIQWVFITQVVIAAPEKVRNILYELMNLKFGVEAPRERNLICIQSLGFRHAINNEFVKRHFPLDTITKVNAIITEIFEVFRGLLRQTSWLKTNEQQIIQDKLGSIVRLIGYPEWYDDFANINDRYSESIPDKPYGNRKCLFSNEQCNRTRKVISKPRHGIHITLPHVLAILAFGSKGNLARGGRLSVFQDSGIKCTIFSYSVFPAAILQGPIFSTDDPLVFQYAKFGILVGHEIAHAFDMIGAVLDKDNRKNWWSNETEQIIQSKGDCFVRQYDNYTVHKDDNMTINALGNFTLNENIADFHGWRAAYLAYENVKTSEDANLRLPGLESYDDRQLFFLALTALYCSAEKAAYYKLAQNDPHPILRLRVIGSLSNMEEFSAAFNCSDTAKMNPQTKCGIWGTDN